MEYSNWKIRRRLLLSLVCLFTLGTLPMWADADYEEVITLNPRTARFEYRPGEVIVKFKGSSGVNIQKKNGKFRTASNSAVDNLLNSLGVEEVEQLMPNTGATGIGKKRKAFNGTDVVAQDLSQLYVVKMADGAQTEVNEAVRQLQELEEVEFAEPNYLVHTLEGEITETPTDPMYSLQYGISAIKLDELWGKPVISKEGPVIAILDTGVEIDHPDLQANIWTNEKEFEGSEGYDDDGNGFKDDIHGWDFVNNTGEIYDYNGHGTHCAGIAAACGFNGTGIIGANPDARIMPVIVMQSNGTGDIATIIKGVDYAAANGADIISMSIGGYSSSIAYEQALGKAYQTAIIVAAAGNDGYCLNHAHKEKGQPAPMPMFPAAYNFVLGVQASASNGNLAGFTNYDDNGPIFSEYSEEQLYNYEITAPGVSIISTYPGGKYKELNGTSMATPLVAGALSRLLQTKEYTNWELLFGDLIHTVGSNNVLDIMAAYKIEDKDRKPELQIVGIEMVDEDGDGRADAGEEISFYPVIRNTWGNVSGIKISLENGETGPAPYEIIENNAGFGSTLSSYGKAKSVNPLKIKLNDDVADGRIVVLKFIASTDNAKAIELSTEIVVENGVEIGGMITQNTTLHPDVNYIVSTPLAVPKGVTLTIEPGTILKFKDNTGLSISGELVCNGTKDNFITFIAADHSVGKIQGFQGIQKPLLNENGFNKLDEHGMYIYIGSLFSYCVFDGFTLASNNKDITFDNCIICNTNSSYGFLCGLSDPIITQNCNYYNNYYHYTNNLKLENTNFLYNYQTYQTLQKNSPAVVFDFDDGKYYSYVKNSNIFNCYSDALNLPLYISFDSTSPDILYFDYPCYFGSAEKSIVSKGIWDINNNNGYGLIDLSNMLKKPSPEAHGIVWKVEVNGKDAQDEFDEMSPLGVGQHEFKVYFNRPMNTEFTPSISMGVRPPYTQVAVAEDGQWNEAGDIYTAKLTIKGNADYDGLNRIYIDGALDNENFPIPPENVRFNVYVSAAGSMSDGFMATPGLGKVDLEWEASDKEIDDVLGYNLYRYTVNEEGIASDTIQINKRLIDDIKFTDFDVEPRTTYLYYYKTLRTNMSENSPSKVVAATPLTASKGDANGSMTVDVADVVTQVSYITGGNPQPFIFEAADVNSDEDINVLDIVGTVNIINTPLDGSKNSSLEELSTAYFSVEDGTLYVDCDQPIGGVQVRLNADKSKNNISKASDLNGFEEVANWLSDNEYLYMAFSMSGQTIAPGKHSLLKINDAGITEMVASNVAGANLPVELRSGSSNVATVESKADFRAYPNPVSDIVNLDYVVPGDSKVFFIVTNLQGALVDKRSALSPAGKNTVVMNLSNLPEGVYFIQAILDGKTLNTYKVIKK